VLACTVGHMVAFTVNAALVVLRSESPSGKCAKLHTVAASNNWDHPIIACSWHIHKWVIFFAHIPFMVNRTFNECQQRRCNNIPSFYNKQHRSHVLFAKSAPGMTLNIQVTAPFCCDWKAQVANAQSFTLWQQATIQITQWDRSIIACSCHMLCIWV